MKKRPLLILFALLLTFMLNRLQAQHFQFFDLPPNTELLPLTRFEVHENNLYFWLKEINFPNTKYYLARFDRSNIHTVALSTGLTPTIYNLKSYNGKLYAVLRNIRGNLGLYAHDGVSFTSIPLPTNHIFSEFEELEVYNGKLVMGLKNRTNGTLTLFNFDGSVFTPIALCAGCEIGPGGPVGHNAHDEMIVYKNKLYILGRAPQPPPYDYDYIETLLIYDGTTITYNQNLYLQYPEKHNQLYIYDNLLFQSYEQSGFDGNSFVYPRLFYPSITIDDQYRQHAWIYGNTLGRTVYNGAVYSASAEIYFAPELDFYRRRLYAWSKIESKAREIFLPDGWYFKGDQYEEFDTHLIDFNCRLFMFLNHAQQGQKLVAMVESYINTCDFTPIFNSTVSFNVYPNSNNGTFTLKSSDALSEEFYDVKIFNDKGMLMLQQKVSSNKENTFDCTAFPKGLYHIIISNNKGESTMKRVNMQ